MLLLHCHRIDGKRRSPKVVVVRDPAKYELLPEWDIFDISAEPSMAPSLKPSSSPSIHPSQTASSYPSAKPSFLPSPSPSVVPSQDPTLSPSLKPSTLPSFLPSVRPSISPSSVPSNEPSERPSNQPSASPSLTPSDEPSEQPSNKPSASPVTLSPTELFPLGQVPDINDPSSKAYFNYNPYDKIYGPGQSEQKIYYYNITEEEEVNKRALHNVNNTTSNMPSFIDPINTGYMSERMTSVVNITVTKSLEYTEYQENNWTTVRNSMEYKYWKDFDMNRTLGNRCASEPWRTQSPIDLCETHVNTDCLEHHQIRTRAGDYNLNDTEVELKILPSKLRIKYSRSNSQLDPNIGLLPPHADFPLNWNGYISAVHIDIKIPSEHTICGERFAGEYQIYFYHPKRRQPVIQSVLIKIHPDGRKHKHFQKALNEWQLLFNLTKIECENYERRLKKEENKFLRRMRNYVQASVDSDEFSLIGDDSSMDKLEKEENDEKEFQKMLRWTRKRAANPRFEEVYESFEGNDEESVANHSQPISMNEGRNENECMKDSNHTFMLGDLNRTCCDLTHPDLQWGCKQDRLFENCPNTCTNLTSNVVNSTSESDSQSPTPTPSPTTTPHPNWNPFWPRIINSIHFYGYGGSLTEPPCSEWVAWRVLDSPMEISYDQWNQMRNILFNQVDENCRRTSAHWGGSVARPIQSLNQRPLWKCTKNDYVSDVEKRLNDSS